MNTRSYVTASGLLLAALGCREGTAPEPGAETPSATVRASITALALSNTWSTKAPMLYGRSQIPAGTINGIIYAVGGRSSTTEGTTTLQAYNVATNTWSTRRSLPVPGRYLNGASVINGRLYVTGGFSKALFVYDPLANTWTRKADVPSPTGYGAQGVIGGQLYVYSAYLADRFWRYNPATNTWTKLAAPVDHAFPGAGVIGGKFYLAGGENEYLIVEWLQVYNPATNSWTWKADMPIRVRSVASAVINGKLYVAGGVQRTDASPYQQTVATLLVYDPLTNRWTAKRSMPAPRADAAGAAAGGKFFVIGGSDGANIVRKVQAYTP